MTNQQNNNTSTINVPSSLSVQQICATATSNGHHSTSNGNAVNGSLVPHSQSAHEIGQVPLTPLAQHQQALHHQLQLRFANANNTSSGKFKFKLLYTHPSFALRPLRTLWSATQVLLYNRVCQVDVGTLCN